MMTNTPLNCIIRCQLKWPSPLLKVILVWESRKFCAHFYIKFFVDLDKIQYTAKAHAEFCWYEQYSTDRTYIGDFVNNMFYD